MKFGIIGNLDKPELSNAVALLVSRLDRSGMEYMLETSLAALLEKNGVRFKLKWTGTREHCHKDVDMLVAFGGDGTMLAAARLVGAAGTPILGVNLGKLGFLAELAPEELQEAIGEILDRKFVVEKRLVLQANVSGSPGKMLHGLNDVVVDKSRSSRMINVDVYINDVFAVTYRGDGLIISTPTGSTAYALSSGGPIVTPTSGVFGITPVSPHTLSGRPLIIPDTDTIRVVAQAHSDEILISVDGQEEAALKPPAEVKIRKATHTINLVKRSGRSYFDVLRAKLLWGKDARGA
jgi:NAD+ kinase